MHAIRKILHETRVASVLRWGMLSLLSLVLASASSAEPLLKDGDRVLFIGNSYTFFHGGLPRHLKDVCQAAKEPLRVETSMVTAGGKELSYLYESTDAVEKIRSGNWDVVILQGGYNDPILKEKHDEFKEAVRKFHAVITESGAQPAIWAVWEQKGHKVEWNMWQRIRDVTHEIADALDMPVIPVGTVWAQVRRSGLEGVTADGEAFLYQDFVHPTKQAFHMNTLIFYSYLTGNSCVGLDYKDLNGVFLDPTHRDVVQKAVWKVLQGDQ